MQEVPCGLVAHAPNVQPTTELHKAVGLFKQTSVFGGQVVETVSLLQRRAFVSEVGKFDQVALRVLKPPYRSGGRRLDLRVFLYVLFRFGSKEVSTCLLSQQHEN